MTMCHTGRRNAGFTVTELLIVITIAAILAAIGIPSYRAFTSTSRIAAEVNGLLGDMQLARSEAIKQGLFATVCMSTDGASCATSGLAWHGGWIVFLDNNGNQTVDGAPDTLLKVQPGFSSTDTFVADNARAVTFNREGFAQLVPGGGVTASTLITLNAAPASAASTRCLLLNQLGKMKVQKAGEGTCT